MKKVIFIGGTSYSGTTLLDMILANDPKGYSLGEFSAVIKPWRKHHYSEKNKLIKNNHKWHSLLEDSDNIYSKLFDTYPEIDFFVDSSKNPIWIAKNTRLLEKQNINYQIVLIYKNPEELANSFYKRNLLSKWKVNYRSYHKKFFSLINNYYKISYEDLINNEEEFKKLCNYLDIDYFKEKKEFWSKEHKTFFGNNRTRSHVDGLIQTGQEKAEEYNSTQKKKLIYEENIPEDVKWQVIEDKKKYADIKMIEDFLENHQNLNRDLILNPFIIKTKNTIKKTLLSYKSRLAYEFNL